MSSINQTNVTPIPRNGGKGGQVATSGNSLPVAGNKSDTALTLTNKPSGLLPENRSLSGAVSAKESGNIDSTTTFPSSLKTNFGYSISNKVLAEIDDKTTIEYEESRRDAVISAVIKLNDYVQNVQRDLEFSVDEDAGTYVVKVIDRKSREVIRQIPSEEALDLARKLNDQEPLRLFSAQV